MFETSDSVTDFIIKSYVNAQQELIFFCFTKTLEHASSDICLQLHQVIVNQLFNDAHSDQKFMIVINILACKIVHCTICVQKQERRKSRET